MESSVTYISRCTPKNDLQPEGTNETVKGSRFTMGWGVGWGKDDSRLSSFTNISILIHLFKFAPPHFTDPKYPSGL